MTRDIIKAIEKHEELQRKYIQLGEQISIMYRELEDVAYEDGTEDESLELMFNEMEENVLEATEESMELLEQMAHQVAEIESRAEEDQ